MPMLVVGADTEVGRHIVDAAAARRGELRVFVSDESEAEAFRARAVKVALGDVSDASHVGGAAIGCFTVVLVAEAASDARERSFATDADAIVAAWVGTVIEAGVQRVILVGGRTADSVRHALETVPESAVVEDTESAAGIARAVVALDDATTI